VTSKVGPVGKTTSSFKRPAREKVYAGCPARQGVTVQDCGITLPGTPYMQNNTIWGDDQLDQAYHLSGKKKGEPETIADAGCAMTSLCNALAAFGAAISPEDLNTWLNSNNGFTGNGVILWSNALTEASDKVQGHAVHVDMFVTDPVTKKPTDVPNTANATPLTTLTTYLQTCYLVIVEVSDEHSSGFIQPHWVLVTRIDGSTYDIIDPNYPSRTKLSSYSNTFWGYCAISKKD
jgi:hypothetical protein